MHNVLFRLKILTLVLVLFCSCTNEKQTAPVQKPQQLPTTGSWCYFKVNDDNTLLLKTTQSITAIPPTDFHPWTETIRVADFGLIQGSPVFLINKYGLLPFDTVFAKKILVPQHEFFPCTTVGGLYIFADKHYIRLYKNTFFSASTDKHNKENGCFLLQADIFSQEFLYKPFAFTHYLNLPSHAQCTALECIKNKWYASFKIDNNANVVFSHIKCPDFAFFGQENAKTERISVSEFQEVCKPAPIEKLPIMVRTIVETITMPETLYIHFSSDETIHRILFKKDMSSSYQGEHKNTTSFLEAHAILYTNEHKERYAALLLPKGDFFINSGTTGLQHKKLPSLPDNFLYTHFFIKNDILIAAWEEKAFYEIGRTGFFTAHLQELK